jgi:hypothetical protein
MAGVVLAYTLHAPHQHEPLVDEATFEAVQAIMTARVLSGEKPKQRSRYL